jgi:hypothetical protein
MKPGDKVIIKEYHKQLELVGKKAKIIIMVDPEMNKYPVQVLLEEAIMVKMDTPMGKGEMPFFGPFAFRENELELAPEDKPATIPDDILKAFDEKPPEEHGKGK